MAASTSDWPASLTALLPRLSFSPKFLDYFNPSTIPMLVPGLANFADDRVIFQPSCRTQLVITTGLSALLYFTENKVIKVLVFSTIFRTVHSAVNYTFNSFQYQSRNLAPGPSLIHGLPPKSCHSHSYHCVTEGHADTDPLSVQIGLDDHVPRWALGSVLTYVICTETFPSSDDASFATNQLTKAIYTWMGVGASFKQVKRGCKANFRVVYRHRQPSHREGVLASAFFPNNGSRNERTLYVYALAFSDVHINNQANILAHEIGHILGLRHEFAMERERGSWSATWMNRSRNSVMDYYTDLSLLRVQQQDLKELKAFYDSVMTEYQGKPVIDFAPRSFVYPSVRRRRQKRAKRASS